jgi:glucose-6-phosphate isomerase
LSNIKLDIGNLMPFLSDGEIENLQPKIRKIHGEMERGEGLGSKFLGWLHLPSNISEDLIYRIEETASIVEDNADIFIVIGIGGSYLGARAAMEFVNSTFYNQLPVTKRKTPEVYFAGHNISSDYISDLIDIMGDKDICLNVISKSGTTTEPAIAFRILRDVLEKRYSREELKKRIIVTTDREKGPLKVLADSEGYRTFVIPDDVGGRYSVLSPVGLLPISISGIDIKELIEGARVFEGVTSSSDISKNPSYLYAAARNLLYQKGKQIEILATFHPSLHYLAEWWKQLAGESEGKNLQGVFPASVDLTTDLHSMGQWIQEGRRIIYETFVIIERSSREFVVPGIKSDEDGLNYLAGRSLDFVNDKAYRGTATAHREGGVPNMTISLNDRSPYTLGQLFYFFERAIALSGYLSEINPFDQPGVELYKKNMFSLLGKQGH